MFLRSIVIFLLLFVAVSAEEEVEYRFCFVGCNRLGFEVNTAENPSTANLQQLHNTFREVTRMSPKPSHMFFVGDIILGYTGYLSTVDQLQGWVAEYRKSEMYGSGVEMVPVVGNHEVLLSLQDKTTKLWHDYPNPVAVKAWKEVLRPYNKWRNGPTNEAPNPDGLTLSQNDLSFTVRHQGLLFIVLNTDTFIDNTTTGDIPLHWLESRLEAATADPTIEHVFVLGHKPFIKAEFEAWIVREEEAEAAQELLVGCPKVRAYLTSHYHFWDYRAMKGEVPQIIAGNGGSPLKGSFLEPGAGYFGYTVVDIMKSGEIVVESWGRPVPEPYSSEEPQPAATLREREVIKPR